MAAPLSGLKVDRGIKPARQIAMSDGMAALEQRLATAKKQKPMKNAKRPGATKGGFMKSFNSRGTSKPYRPEGPISTVSQGSEGFKTPWNKTGVKAFGKNQVGKPKGGAGSFGGK